MKKCFILAASLMMSVAHAENCDSAKLVLNPSVETKAACEAMQLQGSASIKACESSINKAELTAEVGGVYEMAGVVDAWVSKTAFTDDEIGQTVTSIVTVNLLNKTYHGKVITTDRRGHRSNVDCAGTLVIK